MLFPAAGNPAQEPIVVPRRLGPVLEANPFCEPLRSMYASLTASGAMSWNQVEQDFLRAMSDFDTGISRDPSLVQAPNRATLLSAALQNGKGDWFNNVAAFLLEKCAGIETLYVRREVPGLIIPTHNLDGVYPGDRNREIEFLLEAKMMGTPKHSNSPKQEAGGRPGSADTNKRVKELAFKSIDLKGEASRRLAAVGRAPTGGGAGGGDISTWLHQSRPRIYFLMGVRVLSDSDFAAVVRWAATAAQVVDAVGLYCYEPTGQSLTEYRRRPGVPTAYELERVLYRACIDLRALKAQPPLPIPADVPPSPAAEAAAIEREASKEASDP